MGPRARILRSPDLERISRCEIEGSCEGVYRNRKYVGRQIVIKLTTDNATIEGIQNIRL